MIHGIINIYKEKGFTSFDVVAKLRGIFHQKKIGHTGTLDPDAEGVLPVCLGRATKVCDLLTDKDKVYEAVLLLGTETDTQDISGQVLRRTEVRFRQEGEAPVTGAGEQEQDDKELEIGDEEQEREGEATVTGAGEQDDKELEIGDEEQEREGEAPVTGAGEQDDKELEIGDEEQEQEPEASETGIGEKEQESEAPGIETGEKERKQESEVPGSVARELSSSRVREAILSFQGGYDQVPPMYSALKVNGQKLYDLARKGITVERKPRPVEIYSIEILEMELPRVRMRVCCSKGTYIRTLCHDIGQKLGCGACMEQLLRTKVASFTIREALKLEQVEKLAAEGAISPYILSVDRLFGQYPAMEVMDAPQTKKLLRNGNRIPASYIRKMREGSCAAGDRTDVHEDEREVSQGEMAEQVRLYSHDGQFIGLYSFQEKQNDYKPFKIFISTEEL